MIFEAVNQTRDKIWSDFGAEQKWRAERKASLLFIPLFLREREICEEIFSKRAKVFVHMRLLKAVSVQLLMFMRFDSDIVLVFRLVLIGIECFK